MKTTCFLLFLLALNGLKAQKPLHEQAWDLYHKEDYTQAIQVATKAIEKDPKNCKAFLVRGESHQLLNELALAMEDLLFATQCDPKDYLAFSCLAEVYADYGDLEMAMANYSKSIELNRTYIPNYIDRALCKKELGKYEEALLDLKTASGIDSLDYEALGLMGEIYVRLKKYDEAEEQLQKSVSLSPNSVNVSLLGVSKANLGNYQGAIDTFTKAMEYEHANKAGLHVYIGQMYLYLKKNAEACKEFETGYKLGDLEGYELQKQHCK